MTEPVMIIRGFPGPLFESPRALEGLVENLRVLIGLPDEQLSKLQRHLTNSVGFLDPKAALKAISEVVNDSVAAEAVRKVLINIGPSQIDQVVTTLQKGLKEDNFPFDADQFDRLKRVLKDLIRPYPALVRYNKAKHLMDVTGQQPESIELICDIRPIFDESRKYIEGLMPYTRFHITATGEDGLPKPFEVELTHQQVIDLAEKAEKAKNKLETLSKSIATWLPGGLPDVPLTRISRKGPGDA